jgi:ubiquinone/menaquinone biosynthesis C-methylase UbiE
MSARVYTLECFRDEISPRVSAATPAFNISKSKAMELELGSQILGMLKLLGIIRGHTVLDFGCGYGTDTIPVAEIVGDQGRVYALDKDKDALDALIQRGELAGLDNINRMQTLGELEILLTDESVDVVLLLDVFHSFFFPDAVDRRNLLDEIHRIMKPSAFLSISVWPNLVELKAEDERKDAGFHLEKEISGAFTDSNKRLETCRFLNFGKV